ncbi:hypothetical protein DFH27DRAFT_170417 [Peziza echinospora]|nr:hypothetical protein DFH27DRAFT_170417 [Peziza echinospora]
MVVGGPNGKCVPVWHLLCPSEDRARQPPTPPYSLLPFQHLAPSLPLLQTTPEFVNQSLPYISIPSHPNLGYILTLCVPVLCALVAFLRPGGSGRARDWHPASGVCDKRLNLRISLRSSMSMPLRRYIMQQHRFIPSPSACHCRSCPPVNGPLSPSITHGISR